MDEKMIKKITHGCDRYIHIMDTIRKTDVSKDLVFQNVFNVFYRVIPFRDSAWQNVYYSYLEAHKNSTMDIKDVIVYLYENTPQKRVELSFASKLLHTIDASFPIYDKNVANFLNKHFCNNSIKYVLPAYWSDDRKIKQRLNDYQILCDWYKTSASQSQVNTFDTLFPQYSDKIGWLKKADFIIWAKL